MSFYRSIADYYDQIFPLSEPQISFVLSVISGAGKSGSVLDIGCSTGSLAIALAENSFVCTGIDSDNEMIRIAGKKALAEKAKVSFRVMDMLDIATSVQEDFNSITCLGNTLVHLKNRSTIESFLRQCKKILAPEGKLIIQIINYDRIMAKKVESLPAIENDTIRFERHYKHKDRKIDFITNLHIKENNRDINNAITLLPLLKDDLIGSLSTAGFHKVQIYGGFSRAEYNRDSYALVVIAA